MATILKRQQYVPRMYSIFDHTPLSNQTMIHVLPSRHHGCLCGRKWGYMSYNPAAVSATVISSSLQYPSGSSRLAFKSPTTSRSNPRGCSLRAARTLSIVRGVIGDEVTSDDVPSPLPRHVARSAGWPPQHISVTVARTLRLRRGVESMRT